MTLITSRTTGGLAEQVKAVRQGAGVADLSDRGKVRITGRDRATWLHGMTTNEVQSLQPGEGNYGAFLTNRGKMLGDYRLVVCEDFLLFDTEPEVRDSLPATLDRYLISEDAAILPEHDAWALLGVFGTGSGSALATALGADLPPLALYHSTLVADVIVARQNRTGEEGYDVWAPAQEGQGLYDALVAAGAAPIGDEALEILRIEAGIPRYGADMTDETIPLEARLDHAVSFTKGCYVGQEIVARMHYRGHANWLLVGLRFEGERVPASGTDLFAGEDTAKRSGWVTSAAYSPTLDAVIGLGYVRVEQLEEATRLAAKHAAGWIAAQVVETPFVVPTAR
jgi:folate-binding protein YgfZ